MSADMMGSDTTRDRALAQHIAKKLLAIRDKHAASKTEMARYSVFMVTPRGYTHVTTLSAPSLSDACSQHVRAWHSRVSSCAVVMRSPCGKRFSYDDSRRVVEGALFTKAVRHQLEPAWAADTQRKIHAMGKWPKGIPYPQQEIQP